MILPVFPETVPSVPRFWCLVPKFTFSTPDMMGAWLLLAGRWLGCHYLPHSNRAFLKQLRLILVLNLLDPSKSCEGRLGSCDEQAMVKEAVCLHSTAFHN